LKILIYEHISGGGYASQPISRSVLAEGFGILRTIVSDLKAAEHEITVLLDDSLSKLNPPLNADYIVPIFYSEEAKKLLVNIAKINDAILVIAPETGQTLQSIVDLVKKTGKISLNCESKTIQKVIDKTVLYQILEKKGISTPRTLVFNVTEDLMQIKREIKSKLSYPLVFKPVDGVSCNGLSMVQEEDQIAQAIKKIKIESCNRLFIVQKFIHGETASVSLICAKSKALPLSLNQQIVKIGSPEDISSYEGGAVPFDHPFKEEAFALAAKTAACFSGLKGYVGVDLVLGKNKLFVMDVNPRLTTSYVGLSRIANFNVAQVGVNAILKDELPTKTETNGFVCFSKLETPLPTISDFQRAAQISEVVSPPFPLNDNQKACGLIAGQGTSMEDAGLRLEEAKKRLLNIITRGK